MVIPKLAGTALGEGNGNPPHKLCQENPMDRGNVRADGSLEKVIMQGKIEGTQRRGRPAIRWLDNIQGVTGKNMGQLVTMTRDRKRWRAFVHGITRGRSRLDGS